MRETFPYKSFHQFLVADVFPSGLSDDDALLLFSLLHTHVFSVTECAATNAKDVRGFAAITQRHAGECVGYLWPESDDQRRHYTYWYRRWNADWSYDRVYDLAGAELDRFNRLKQMIVAHPAVDSMDWEEDD